MPRYLVQSESTGCFLAPSIIDGTPEWVRRLRDAGGGVVFDLESAQAMAIEYAERGESFFVVDIDRLGSAFDY